MHYFVSAFIKERPFQQRVQHRFILDFSETYYIGQASGLFGSEEDSFCYAFAFAEEPPEGPVAGACGREFGI